MSIVCEAQDVSFEIAGAKLLTSVSVELRATRIVAVLGPNGAGKSTLLRVLTGDCRPSSGKVRYQGGDLSNLGAWQLALQRAVMSQAVDLTFPFRVDEIVDMGADGLRIPISSSERRKIIDRCAELADVAHLSGRLYPTLSGGERQRVQFARALVQIECIRRRTESPVLFLDEPVASLDLFHQWQLLESVRTIAKAGAAVFVVMHDINLALTYADEIILLKKGEVFARGAPSEVMSAEVLEAVFSLVPRVSGSMLSPPPVVPQLYQAQGSECGFRAASGI